MNNLNGIAFDDSIQLIVHPNKLRVLCQFRKRKRVGVGTGRSQPAQDMFYCRIDTSFEGNLDNSSLRTSVCLTIWCGFGEGSITPKLYHTINWLNAPFCMSSKDASGHHHLSTRC